MGPQRGERPEPTSLNRRRVLQGAATLAWTAPVVMVIDPDPALAGSPVDEPGDDNGPGGGGEPDNDGDHQDDGTEDNGDPGDDAETDADEVDSDEVDDDIETDTDDTGDPGDDREPRSNQPHDDRRSTEPVEPQEPRQRPVEVEPVAREEPPPDLPVEQVVLERGASSSRDEVRRALADTGLHAGWLSATGAAALVIGGAAVAEAKRRERRSAVEGQAAEHPDAAPATVSGLPVPPDRPEEEDR